LLSRKHFGQVYIFFSDTLTCSDGNFENFVDGKNYDLDQGR